MPTNVDDIIRKLPPARRKKIEARAKELIAEEMTRQQLRRALEKTQVQVAQKLGITQDSVCRLEQRADVLISTLRDYIEAMGGSLSIVADFPKLGSVKLAGIAEDDPPAPPAAGRKRSKALA